MSNASRNRAAAAMAGRRMPESRFVCSCSIRSSDMATRPSRSGSGAPHILRLGETRLRGSEGCVDGEEPLARRRGRQGRQRNRLRLPAESQFEPFRLRPGGGGGGRGPASVFRGRRDGGRRRLGGARRLGASGRGDHGHARVAREGALDETRNDRGAGFELRLAQNEALDLSLDAVLIDELPARQLIEAQAQGGDAVFVGVLHPELALDQIGEQLVVKGQIAGGAKERRGRESGKRAGGGQGAGRQTIAAAAIAARHFENDVPWRPDE